MKKVSRLHMLVLALSLAFSPARAIDEGKIWLGAAIALLAGLVWWANAPETNEHMLSRVQEEYDVTNWLMPYVDACESAMPVAPHALQEDQLKALLYTALNNFSIRSLETRVDQYLNVLATGKYELEKRIRECTGAPKQAKTIEAMQALVRDITQRYERIRTVLKTLFDFHGSYFKALQCYGTIYNVYVDEISILERYYYDTVLCDMHIKALVSSNRSHNSYPFIQYYDNTLAYQKRLQNFVHTLLPTYPDIKHKMQQLLNHVDYIRSVIVTSTEYTRDVLQKEQDAIKEAQRKLAEQQERFRRQQERAHHEMRMAHIDLAIQQMAFKTEQKEELKKLRKERRKLEQLLNASRA